MKLRKQKGVSLLEVFTVIIAVGVLAGCDATPPNL